MMATVFYFPMPTVELGLKHQWFPIAPTGNNMQEHQSMSTKTVEEFMLNGMNVVCAIICSAATLATMPPALSGIHFSPLVLFTNVKISTTIIINPIKPI
jgi:hypothetical protein